MHRRLLYALVSVIGTTGLALTFAAGASASTTGSHPGTPVKNSPTAACEAEFGIFCQEPVVAQAIPSSQNLVPDSDAAMSVTGPSGLVGINADNDLQDGTQDFAFAPIARIPDPGGGPGAFGFTGFDRHNYGGDTVYNIEWTPFGFDTGLCDQVVSLNRIAVRPCDGGADQAFFTHVGNIPLAGTTPPGYVWAMSVEQVLNAQHHLCLTSPPILSAGVLTVSRCLHIGQFPLPKGGRQYWTSIT